MDATVVPQDPPPKTTTFGSRKAAMRISVLPHPRVWGLIWCAGGPGSALTILTMTSVSIPAVVAANPEGLTQAGGHVGASATAVRQQHRTGRKAVANLRDGWAGTASDAAAGSALRTLQQQRQ